METKQDELTLLEQIRISKRIIEMYQNKIEKLPHEKDIWDKEISLEQSNLHNLHIEAGFYLESCYLTGCDGAFFVDPKEPKSFYKCPKCKQLLDSNEYFMPF